MLKSFGEFKSLTQRRPPLPRSFPPHPTRSKERSQPSPPEKAPSRPSLLRWDNPPRKNGVTESFGSTDKQWFAGTAQKYVKYVKIQIESPLMVGSMPWCMGAGIVAVEGLPGVYKSEKSHQVKSAPPSGYPALFPWQNCNRIYI